MPNNVYSDIHLHITWHTKHGAVVEPAFEDLLHQFIRNTPSGMQAFAFMP